MNFPLLLLVSFVGLLDASGYQCSPLMKLSPPADLSQPLNWPVIWNDTMPPIPFNSNQNCEWQISVPDGYYATAVFYKNAPSTVGIWVEYPNGYSVGLDNADRNPFIFTAPQFSIHLGKSQQEGAFSFKVTWSKYPNVIRTNGNLVRGGRPIAQVPNAYLTTYTADTAVSLVAFTTKNSSFSPLLRQSVIFDGDSTSSKYLGNLLQVLNSKKALISTGNKMTFYTFGLNELFDYTLYMVQDHSGDQDIGQVKGWNCPSDTECPVNINAISSNSVIVTVDNKRPEFIKSIAVFPLGATLQVYEGAITNQTMIAALTKSNYQNYLPLEIKGTLKQYYLDSGFMQMQLTKDATDAQWGTVYDGRIINVHSFDYGTNSYRQDTSETFTTPKNQKLYFSFNAFNSDFNGSTTLAVTIYRDGAVVFKHTYNSSDRPTNHILKVFGDKMTVEYMTNGNYSKGFQMDLTTTKN